MAYWLVGFFFFGLNIGLLAFLQGVGAWLLNLELWQLALGALLIGYAIDPDETKDMVEDVSTDVGGFFGNVSSSLLKGFLNSPLGWVVIGGLTWLFFFKDKDKEDDETKVTLVPSY